MASRASKRWSPRYVVTSNLLFPWLGSHRCEHAQNTPHAHANALVASQVLPAGESDLDVGLLTDSEADSEEEEGDEEEEEVVVRVKRQRT